MQLLDWGIIGALLLILVVTLIISQRQVKSTADFLAANRCAGRYLLAVTDGIAGLGAISIIATFEQYYVAGFSPVWWGFLSGPIALLMSICGWVYYRFRETRCFTMAQFFEVRYSRRFRVFSGMLGWLSGVLNYGIFPSVSVKFFMFFCKLPDSFQIAGIPFEFSTYVCLLLFVISLGVTFAICGGQLTIMLTDFIQGTFCNIVFLVLMIFMVMQFNWETIFETLTVHAAENQGQSLFNPFDTTGIRDFNIWYFLMGIVLMVLTSGTWQGSSGYAAAAKSAHEAKMARFLGVWRQLVQCALLLFIPICAFTFFNSPQYADSAQAVAETLGMLHGQEVSQARVPLFLSHILPSGLLGLFAALMLAAMLSTDDTYMHSWGSIFVQDVIMPFRKKPFTEKQHILLLRLSIVFVGVFAFFFSWLFKQTEYIMLFFQITGAIFTGGAGAVLIGGLYSRSGSTLGAWVAMILGSGLALGSIALQQCWPALAPVLAEHAPESVAQWLLARRERFPVNSQVLAFAITLIGFASYFIVSYIDRKVHGTEYFNLEKMLHRGKYDISGEHREVWSAGKIWRILGLTDEFTRFDRLLFFASLLWTLLWTAVFVAGTLGHFVFGWQPLHWLRLWRGYVMLGFGLGAATTIWFLIGGSADVVKLFRELRTRKRNDADDGRVINGRNAGEEPAEPVTDPSGD